MLEVLQSPCSPEQTLLLGLDNSYADRLSWQCATELWYRGLVVAIEAYDHEMWSTFWSDDLDMEWFTYVETPVRKDAIPLYEFASSELRVVVNRPAVVRFKKPKYKSSGVVFNRRNIFLRDNYTCQYCKNKFRASELTLDHVHPRSLGGATAWDNIVAACHACNFEKANRTPEQWGRPLDVRPCRPESLAKSSTRTIVEDPSTPLCWIPYLKLIAN